MSRKKITIDKLFSDRLKTLIDERLGVTQAAFSKKIGISQGYLSMVLKGVRGASAELIAGLYIHHSDYLSWLLTGEGEMTREPEKKVGIAESPTYIYKERIDHSRGDDDPGIADLLESTRRVLKSGNQVAFDALERNIRYFDHAIKTEKRLKNIEEKILRMEDGEKQESQIRGNGSNVEKGKILKKRAM